MEFALVSGDRVSCAFPTFLEVTSIVEKLGLLAEKGVENGNNILR
jgi:hypothetical protein